MAELENQTNNTEDPQTVDKVKESITFLINLVSVCVERGGYNIDDVINETSTSIFLYFPFFFLSFFVLSYDN